MCEEKVEVKKEGVLKRFWDKTIFPEKIANMKERKRLEREEQKQMNEIKKEARVAAVAGMKDELIEHYKKEELKKLTGQDKVEKKQKWKDAFSLQNLGTDDKLNKMMGISNNNVGDDALSKVVGQNESLNKDDKVKQILGNTNNEVVNDDKINTLLGKSNNNNKKEETPEEKIARMLG